MVLHHVRTDLYGGQLLSALALGIIFLMWIADEDVISADRATQRECSTWAI